MTLIEWLRETCKQYEIEPAAVLRRHGSLVWPLTAHNEGELLEKLRKGGYFLPLPTEPAALANIIEVSLVRFLMRKLKDVQEAQPQKGTERGYPDIELSGDAFGGGPHAIDIKVAQRSKSKSKKNTQSRITLYTGNTYFAWPELPWSSTLRPFQEYKSHVDVIGIYTLNPKSLSRVEDFELIVQEPWRIASRQRSSTTREYIGAVTSIDDLRNGKGEFASPEDFYRYWRKFDFKIGKSVKQQLQKLLAEKTAREQAEKEGKPYVPPKAKQRKKVVEFDVDEQFE